MRQGSRVMRNAITATTLAAAVVGVLLVLFQPVYAAGIPQRYIPSICEDNAVGRDFTGSQFAAACAAAAVRRQVLAAAIAITGAVIAFLVSRTSPEGPLVAAS
jgi:hypothetical protein